MWIGSIQFFAPCALASHLASLPVSHVLPLHSLFPLPSLCSCSLFLSSVIFFPLFSFSSFHNNVALSLIRVLSKLVQSFVAVWYSVLPIPLSSYRPRSYSLRSWLHRSRSCAVRSLFLLLHHELSPSFFPVNSDLFCVVFAVGCWFRILCRSPEFSSFSFVVSLLLLLVQ